MWFSSAAFIAFSGLASLGTGSAAVLVIWTPRPHNPAFVKPGNGFLAEVMASGTLSASGWSAVITNELRAWNCSVLSAAYGRCRLNVSAGPGRYAVEAATWLTNWQEQTNFTTTTNHFEYVDSQTNLPRRFYRIRQ